MDEMIELAGKYGFEFSIDETEDNVYASTDSATSLLHRDIQTLKKLTDAEEVEIYRDEYEDYNFLIKLKRSS